MLTFILYVSFNTFHSFLTWYLKVSGLFYLLDYRVIFIRAFISLLSEFYLSSTFSYHLLPLSPNSHHFTLSAFAASGQLHALLWCDGGAWLLLVEAPPWIPRGWDGTTSGRGERWEAERCAPFFSQFQCWQGLCASRQEREREKGSEQKH